MGLDTCISLCRACVSKIESWFSDQRKPPKCRVFLDVFFFFFFFLGTKFPCKSMYFNWLCKCLICPFGQWVDSCLSAELLFCSVSAYFQYFVNLKLRYRLVLRIFARNVQHNLNIISLISLIQEKGKSVV